MDNKKEFNYKIAFYILIGFICGVLLVLGIFFMFNHSKDNQDLKSNNIEEVSNKKTSKKDSSKKNETTENIEKKEESKKEESNKFNSNSNTTKKSNKASNKTDKSIQPVNSEFSDEDNKVIDYLKEKKDIVVSSMTKENAKNLFIEIVDFLFYDGKIKGYTFKELTSKGKMEVTKLCTSIEIAIEERFPGVIDSTKDKYNEKKEKIIEKYNEVINSYCTDKSDICESFRTSYEGMKSSFSNTFKIIKDIGSKAKDKLNTWYSNFKNN